MQRAVDRCAGALENADHLEGLVVVLKQADAGDAVRKHQRIAEPVVQLLGNFRAEHHFEGVRGERPPFSQSQRLFAPVAVMLEIGPVGSEYPVAAVRIA